MSPETPLSVRLLDAYEALRYGAALAEESRSEFIRTAVKDRARGLLERIGPPARKTPARPDR